MIEPPTGVPRSRRSSATLVGFCAILMWSLLALLTAASGRIPPFELAALTFVLGGALGATTWIFRPGILSLLRQPAAVWALGIIGLFGYHALYFTALRLAPPAEAGLVNYLWPLLIVLFSALLPHESLKPHHVAGVLIGLVGTVVLFAGGGITLSSEHLPGLACASVAAFVWASYSVLLRRFHSVPTDVVAGFCLGTAALAFGCHVVFEDTVWPDTAAQWIAVAALGVGPVGAAFYAWDFGIKRGDIRVLGAASYVAPVVSTLLLVATGFAQASVSLVIAAVLIAGGGLLAAKDMLQRPSAK